jgi:hypothetical protein
MPMERHVILMFVIMSSECGCVDEESKAIGRSFRRKQQ